MQIAEKNIHHFVTKMITLRIETTIISYSKAVGHYYILRRGQRPLYISHGRARGHYYISFRVINQDRTKPYASDFSYTSHDKMSDFKNTKTSVENN